MKKYCFLLALCSIYVTLWSQCPSVTLSPISQTLTCNGGLATYTANFSPTANVYGAWFGPGGSLMNVTAASPCVLQTSNPGTYTFTATNLTSSCSISQTVAAVRQMTAIPMMTISASNGFTLSCSTPSTVLQINGSGTIAPVTYTWTNVTTSVSSYVANGSYTVNAPGYYVATFADGNFCLITQTVMVISTCTSFQELTENGEAYFYPNPCHGDFNIRLDKTDHAELRIINSMGQDILTKVLRHGNNKIEIDVARGIYYYSITQNDQPIRWGKVLIE